MGYVNEVLIVGRLGANPELTYTKAGMAVCRLSVATHQKYKKGTQTITETEWHRVVLFGRKAEIAAENLKKGGELYVKGVKRTSVFMDQNTKQQRQKVEIITVDMKWPGSEKIDMTAPQINKPQNQQKTAAVETKGNLPVSGLDTPTSMDDASIEAELNELRKEAHAT